MGEAIEYWVLTGLVAGSAVAGLWAAARWLLS